MKKVFLWLIIVSMIAVFSLTGCKTEAAEEVTEEEAAEDLVEENTVEEVTDELEDEATYIAESLTLSGMITTAMEKGSEAAYSFANSEITIAEHKTLAEQNIKDINTFYDFYLNLKPPDRFKPSHEQLGEAMKHYLNSSIYMQQYIDTENMDEMATNLENATTELNLGNIYMGKATDELGKLK